VEVAINSILSQELSQANFEIIVVNDSGNPLPKSDWHSSPHVRIINTNKSERSFARNSGAAIARGKYLAFLDDDDWILPGALEEFWQLANRYPNASWLYGGIRIVNEQDEVLAEINSGLKGNCLSQIMGGAWAPLQASLIKTQVFFEIGGFDPRICGTEDEDLCQRTAYYGEFANTSEVVACLFRGQTWDTSTNYLRAPEDRKYARNSILSKPNAFSRLRASVDSNYWCGRILRIYLSTISWNLEKKQFFVALSRMVYSIMFLGLSAPRLFSLEYWAGLRAHHAPETLHFVMEAYNLSNQDSKQ
jgi:glycosyltransferase involved in cell wall biosynthesis